MAPAAYLAGYDWSGFLASDGYYYKYGQSLWYLLPFLLIPTAVARYRVMLAVNSALVSLIPVLAWKAARRLGIKGRAAFVIALLTGLYPPILLYSKYTWAETNLMVLPWAVLLLLLRLYGEGEGRRMRDSVLLAAAAVYAYMSHQRGMVLILAVVLTLICLEAASRRAAQRGPCGGKRKGVCRTAFLLTLAAGLLLDSALSGWVKTVVYDGAVMEHNTLRDFLDPELYRKLFSPKGLRVVLDTAAGWLFHSGASTFGCAFLGLFFLFGVVWKRLQGQEKQRQEKRGQGTWEEGQGETGYLAVSLLGLFCYFGAMALGLLFFFQDLYGYFDGSRVERCDHLLFGRYLESSVPLLLFAGLIVLWGKRRESRRLCGAAALLYLCAALVTGLRLLPRMDQVNCYVHSLMALNLFMDTEEVTGTLAVIPNYPEALAAFGLLSFLVFVLLLCMRGRRGRRAGAAVLCVLFLWIYVWNSVTVTGRVDRFGATKYAEVYRTSEAEVYRTSEDA
ncbi:MAG TPA: hypothetical protein H9831_12940 [Candidatus Eisenbergiella pullistercoris]|uniref:Uncharacterized protein n=1 Tax=Candidatus Eisenbergiella pullistercoris TaxID=2838555 RepID=A0A9D1YS50_9FIRM|nr:hypothetical protein [Candidatus Eisenbergiella pullistercoris]